MRQGPNNGRRGRGGSGGGGGRHQGGHQGGGNGGHGGYRDHNVGNNNSGNVGNNNGGPRRSAAALRHQTFDSNGPDVRVRGNAWQVNEKYQALARDATSAGDRVAAENYLQHAEHYHRIIQAINEATAAEMAARGYVPPPQGNEQPGMPPQQQPMTGNMMPQPGQQQQSQQQQMQPPQQAQAEVQMRQPGPFFTPEEVEEERGGPTPLVAGR